MSIKYEHLEDGTPFVALELNNRVTAVTETLNNLSRDQLALGALRTEHVPTPLGHVTGEDAQMTALRPYTYATGTINRLGEVENTRVTFSDTPIDFSTDKVNALLVLANVNLIRFRRTDGTLLTQLNSSAEHLTFEDGFRAIFKVVVTTTDDEEHIVSWSNRATSAGLSVSGIAQNAGSDPRYYCALGGAGAFDGDSESFKDVAIRTVIKAGDFALPIKAVHLKVRTYMYRAAFPVGGDIDIQVKLNKGALTVLPIQCLTGD
jgi:hypothetical protein|tara:strand:- start:2452 stop:3237 length:786 start_codon:yes stop_codon:yes gene_type:complete